MTLELCLPAELRGPATTITRIAAGLSGAGVYRVEAAGQVYVLKVSVHDEPIDAWRWKLQVRQLAASAGLAPQVVHVDEAQRAVVSAFVTDRSFPALFGDPRTRDAALALMGETLRRVHDIPLPPAPPAAPVGAVGREPREFLDLVWAGLAPQFALPAFVGDAVRRVLSEPAPERDCPLVLSHNDVNPTNVVYDGEHLLLLDWDAAGPNDPLFDLAAISVFLRMEDEACRKLLAAHDRAPVSALPVRFAYNQRIVAVMCGVMFLNLARGSGHAGATGAETIESTHSLGEIYQRMRAGELSIASPEGLWQFGLALVKARAAPGA
jgi:aminoglycoside phosphotransferase (APT) family kinase protein